MIWVNQIGTFKVIPVSWDVRKSAQSMSIGIEIEYKILAKQGDSEWEDWTGYDECHVLGTEWIIGKKGLENQRGIENLAKIFGWNGDFYEIPKGPPAIECQVEVELSTWNNESSYKVKWLNALGDDTPADIAELARIYGPKIRAIAGSVSRGPVVSQQAPAQSPPPGLPANEPLSTPPPPPKTDDDDLPF